MSAPPVPVTPQPPAPLVLRDVSTSYLLCCLGFVGFAGIHRFYLGKRVTGVLWFLTFGLFGMGTIVDLFSMTSEVDAYNRRLLKAAGKRPVLAPLEQPVQKRPAALQEPVELRLLRLARDRNGHLTVAIAAAALGLGLQEAERELDKLAADDHAQIEADENGELYYLFPLFKI